MTVRIWDPFREIEALRREVERLFDDTSVRRWPFSRTSFLPGVSARTYPMLNVNEDNDHIYVEALAPGLDPESIEVSVLQNTLRIAGKKTPINEDIKPEAYHRNERGAGSFVRTLTLPVEVDSNKISAEYKNGLLLLTLPKHEKAKPKQITVSVN
ncbi:MAG TPA: Hsp20/alpha crystallin family protein [Candidatus Hydrogenedentes bacterium]|nr:Hsp20/alpha crystallin family protein [Candidatus Hydrogenedentota bacterium]